MTRFGQLQTVANDLYREGYPYAFLMPLGQH